MPLARDGYHLINKPQKKNIQHTHYRGDNAIATN